VPVAKQMSRQKTAHTQTVQAHSAKAELLSARPARAGLLHSKEMCLNAALNQIAL